MAFLPNYAQVHQGIVQLSRNQGFDIVNFNPALPG
jgi:hypothetical protein